MEIEAMRRWLWVGLAAMLVMPVWAESTPPKVVAPGVWFLEGEAKAGYCNSIVIEMGTYLVLVDPSYPGRTKELMAEIPKLSSKPVKYVFDTHAHGDHSYGNSLWTKAGATTLAYVGVREEMDRYEPVRWKSAMEKREDVRALGEADVERPKMVFRGKKFVLKDGEREVDFLWLGWGHTRGDGWVWLPKEKILCTGDAAVNGPRNKLWDAYVANWPRVIDKAVALGPTVVLPGHGAAGGVEILTGQAAFLRDLYAAVEREVKAGVPVEEVRVELPASDANWTRPDMSQHVGIVYAEIKAGKPAGALPHTWQ
jgi:glyoxylase-like metal-dependent hydrolase (beta-lactamase superfamily II)